MTFSQRLTDLMESNGITSYRMSKDTGIPEATIGRWKNGKAIPNGELLAKAVQYLGTSADYLLLGNEQKEKPAAESDRPTDLERILEKQPGLMFHGMPVTDEDRGKLLTAIRIAMEIDNKHKK